MNSPTPSSVFAQRVLHVLRRIPPGRVLTYGDVAALAGRPGAARAVGNIMRLARVPGLPYHRVVAANPQLKVSLLQAEGLTVIRGRIRQFAKYRGSKPRRQRA